MLILIITGAVMTVIDADEIAEGFHQRQWLHADGTIIESDISIERAIEPHITYQYSVDSISYTKTTNLFVPKFGNKRKQFDVARETTHEYHPGQQIIVYYNPVNPQQSTLKPGVPWDIYGKVGFGMCLFILGLTGLLLPSRKKS